MEIFSSQKSNVIGKPYKRNMSPMKNGACTYVNPKGTNFNFHLLQLVIITLHAPLPGVPGVPVVPGCPGSPGDPGGPAGPSLPSRPSRPLQKKIIACAT